MEQYISKSALVAKIDDWRDKIKKGIFIIPLEGHQRADATFEYEILVLVRDLIDTLEVKEVDFEKEFKRFLNEVEGVPRMWHSGEQIEWAKDLAKHFFELGMSVSNKAQKGEEV